MNEQGGGGEKRDPNYWWNYLQDHANDVQRSDESQKPNVFDALREKAKKAGDIFEKIGRPMGGAKDD